jgi:hypothetical protein
LKGEKIVLKEFLPEEDKNIAFDYIILQLLASALTIDIRSIKNSKLKLKKYTCNFYGNHFRLGNKVLSKIKKVIHKKGIKVFDPTIINEDFWSYKYVVRGYGAEFRYFKSALKMNTEKKFIKVLFPCIK